MKEVKLEDFKKRKLEKCYIACYILETTIPMQKEGCTEKVNISIIYGITVLGKRQIIGTYIENKKENRFWLETFEEIKYRGCEHIFYVVYNKNNNNLERGLKLIYKEATHIPSAVDLAWSITKYFPDRYYTSIIKELNILFLSEDTDNFKTNLEFFKEKYKDNKVIMMLFEKQLQNINSYYVFNKNLRKLFYPYYAIRDLIKHISMLGNKAGTFKNIDEFSEAFLWYINKFEKGITHTKKDWLEIINQIYELSNNRLGEYL